MKSLAHCLITFGLLSSVAVACNCMPADSSHHIPGVGFSLAADYGTAVVYFQNGSFVEVSKVEGNPAYKSFMRRRVEGQPESDFCRGINSLCDYLDPLLQPLSLSLCKQDPDFSSTRDLVQSLQSTVTSYLGTPFCFASVAGPVRTWTYQTQVIDRAVRATGLRLTHRVLDASTMAFMANEIDSSDDPDVDSQAVLSVDYSGSALNLVLFAEDRGLTDAIRRDYNANLGAERRGESGHLEALRAAIAKIAEPPFGLDLYNNEITNEIRQIVLHGDAVGDQDFLDVLRAVVGSALVERAHALSPVFASAVGVAKVSQERMADIDFDQEAAFGCRWRSRLYGSSKEEL